MNQRLYQDELDLSSAILGRAQSLHNAVLGAARGNLYNESIWNHVRSLKPLVDILYEKTAKDWDSISLLTGKLEN